MTDAREISLKGKSITWSGMSDQSNLQPAEGAFDLLRNCYVIDDGTEIRRMPPLTLWADPRLCDDPAYSLASSSTPGSTTVVVFSQPHKLANTGAANPLGYRVYVTESGAIQDGWYAIIRGSSDTEAVIFAPSSVSSSSGSFLIERATTPHAMQMVSGYLCIVSESLTTTVLTDGSNLSKASIATWVQEAAIDWRNPLRRFEYWANVLNKPDSRSILVTSTGVAGTATLTGPFGYAVVGSKFYIAITGMTASAIANGTYLATVTKPYLEVTLNTTQNSTPTSGATAVIADESFHRPIRRKSHTDVADGRLLIAAPGEGVCYQAHVGYLDGGTGLSLHRTRSLGVPKAILSDAFDVTDGSGNLADGFYAVAIAYRDYRTGEYGLISERMVVEVAGANNAISIEYHTPRAVMRECYGCTVVVFISDMAATALDVGEGTLKPVKEITTVGSSIDVDAIYTITDEGPETRLIPILENMPMGASVVCTIKGLTYFAGSISNNSQLGNLSLQPVTISETTVDGNPSEITFSPLSIEGVTAVSGAMLADYQVPTSYGGMGLIYGNYSLTELDKRINEATGGSSERHFQRWLVRNVHDEAATVTTATQGYFAMPRGAIWHSEQGHPGIAPSTNRILIDRLRGYDVVGLGRLGDTLVACTDRETYVLQWDRSPLGSDPHCVSTEFGCIAPSSMVQFDGGLAWLSERGPVLMSGGVISWIGGDIQQRWSTYLKDSRGLMLHAFAAHDTERNLILFFLRRDRERPLYQAQVDDDQKSKVACDEILVYSYGSRAWSFWELPIRHEAVAATMIRCGDGLWRMALLTSADKKIYAFDEGIRDTQELADVELWPKRTNYAPLERAYKIGAINLRCEGTIGAIEDKRIAKIGFGTRAAVLDDADNETVLTNFQPMGNLRTRITGGASRGQDQQVKLRFAGVGQLRLKDITLEVSPGG